MHHLATDDAGRLDAAGLASAQTLVNTVNCVGVIGKGIASDFKRRHPEMFSDYVARCDRHEVRLGEPYLHKAKDHWIVNFPTKKHWRAVSRLSDVVDRLDYLESHYRVGYYLASHAPAGVR
jgi:hypothetical protein